MRINSENREYYARSSYERFILSQPHIQCEGLYRDSKGWYYIYCPGSSDDTLAIDDSTISNWLAKHKNMVSPVRLTYSIPEDSVRVKTRTIEEMVRLSGTPLNHSESYEKLKKYLPNNFPVVGLDSATIEENFIKVILTRDLDSIEELVIEKAVNKLALPIDVETRIEPIIPNKEMKLPNNKYSAQRLFPIFYAPTQTPKMIRHIYEDDEDYWVGAETQLFKNNKPQFKNILKSKPVKNACLVNASVFPSINFRILYTLYDHVYLALPIEDRLDTFLQSVKLSKKDLVTLTQEKRLSFLFPQSFNRYRLAELEPLIESSNSMLIGPRRLTALSIAVSKQRFPLLYTSLDAEERATVLRVLYVAKERAKGRESKLIYQLIISLSRIWQSTEDFVQSRGTLGTMATGLGSLYGDLIMALSGTDAWLELTGASQTLEWSIGLQADMIPTQLEGYDEYPNAEHLAALYTGFKSHPYITSAKRSGTIIEGILAVDNDMPILDLVDGIGSADRVRLKGFIEPAAKCELSSEELADAIFKFNKQVRTLEKRSKSLSKLNIGGLIEGSAGIAGVVASALSGSLGLGLGIASTGLLKWILGQLANQRSNSQSIGSVYDAISGAVTNTSSEAAFVARIKRDL